MIYGKIYDYLHEDAKEIREKVFMQEQGFKEEFDEKDNIAMHIVLYVDKKPAAVGRLFPGEIQGIFVIGRVAVLKEFRKMHLGAEVLNQLERKAKALGGLKIVLSAQCRVQEFYERMGYKAKGEIYLDEFCEHVQMEKELK